MPAVPVRGTVRATLAVGVPGGSQPRRCLQQVPCPFSTGHGMSPGTPLLPPVLLGRPFGVVADARGHHGGGSLVLPRLLGASVRSSPISPRSRPADNFQVDSAASLCWVTCKREGKKRVEGEIWGDGFSQAGFGELFPPAEHPRSARVQPGWCPCTSTEADLASEGKPQRALGIRSRLRGCSGRYPIPNLSPAPPQEPWQQRAGEQGCAAALSPAPQSACVCPVAAGVPVSTVPRVLQPHGGRIQPRTRCPGSASLPSQRRFCSLGTRV